MLQLGSAPYYSPIIVLYTLLFNCILYLSVIWRDKVLSPMRTLRQDNLHNTSILHINIFVHKITICWYITLLYLHIKNLMDVLFSSFNVIDCAAQNNCSEIAISTFHMFTLEKLNFDPHLKNSWWVACFYADWLEVCRSEGRCLIWKHAGLLLQPLIYKLY